LTAATAFGKVPRASGFGGPEKPQWVSDSCTKKKSSDSERAPPVPAQPANPEANTTPPSPANLRKSRLSIGRAIAYFSLFGE
jgi:hypothetical protein